MLCLLVILSVFSYAPEVASSGGFKCPSGSIPPTHASDESLCYIFVNQSKTFNDAETYCRQQNGHLTPVNDVFTELFLADQGINRFPSATSFWIGAHVVNYTYSLWYWTKNNGFLTYSNWKNPADSGTSPSVGSCAAVTITDLTWSAVTCTQSMPFVCEIPGAVLACDCGYTLYNGTNMCYKLFYFSQSGEEKTFNQSESICQADGGHLVSIHDEAENTFVSLMAPGRTTNNSMALWIGASSDANKVYTWTDGTPFNYTKWGSGPYASSCTILLSDGDANGNGRMLWNWQRCQQTFGRFICKKPSHPPA